MYEYGYTRDRARGSPRTALRTASRPAPLPRKPTLATARRSALAFSARRPSSMACGGPFCDSALKSDRISVPDLP